MLLDGKFKKSSLFSMRYIPLVGKKALVSFVVSKKVAKMASDRNKIKRRARGALITTRIQTPVAALIFPKKEVGQLPFGDLKDDMQRLFDL